MRASASASAEPKRRPRRASGPWWHSTQCSSASRRASAARRATPRHPLLQHPLADLHVAEQPALLADAEVGAVRELARLADVVHERRRDQQVGVELDVQQARLLRERRDRDRVLQQPAEVGVVPAARARRAPPRARAARRRRAGPPAALSGRCRRPPAPGARGSRRARRGRGRRSAGSGRVDLRRVRSRDRAHVDLQLVAEALDATRHAHEVAPLEAARRARRRRGTRVPAPTPVRSRSSSAR